MNHPPPDFNIGGLHKLTAIDFPGRISALIFTQGCNFHCPYCHNSHLIPFTTPESAKGPDATRLASGEVLSFLSKRRGLLGGVVISGGEPCAQAGLEAFCHEVKAMGFALKLDTNGSRPDVLACLLEKGLLDYVAMDMKAPLILPDTGQNTRCSGNDGWYYPGICASRGMDNTLAQSMALLADSPVPHEFRTTCVKPFVTAENLALIAEAVAACCTGRKTFPWYLQKATLPDKIAMPEGKEQSLHALPVEILRELLPRLAAIVPGVRIRE